MLIITNIGAKGFASHYVLPPMYQQLRGRSVKKMKFVLLCSLTIYSCFDVQIRAALLVVRRNGDIHVVGCLGILPLWYPHERRSAEQLSRFEHCVHSGETGHGLIGGRVWFCL